MCFNLASFTASGILTSLIESEEHAVQRVSDCRAREFTFTIRTSILSVLRGLRFPLVTPEHR
jgi:hypothetical protein